MKIGCVIKAAGKARRFGRNKLLAKLDGRPVLAYVLDAVPRHRFDRFVAVTSDAQVTRLCKDYNIETIFYEGGPVSRTIRLGLEKMTDMDGCMFVSGDQPLCAASSIEQLADAFGKEPWYVYRLCFQETPGAPVIFPDRLFPRLMALDGESGGMSVVDKTEIRTVSALSDVELWDVDTEEMLERTERYLLDNAR